MRPVTHTVKPRGNSQDGLCWASHWLIMPKKRVDRCLFKHVLLLLSWHFRKKIDTDKFPLMRPWKMSKHFKSRGQTNPGVGARRGSSQEVAKQDTLRISRCSGGDVLKFRTRPGLGQRRGLRVGSEGHTSQFFPALIWEINADKRPHGGLCLPSVQLCQFAETKEGLLCQQIDRGTLCSGSRGVTRRSRKPKATFQLLPGTLKTGQWEG